MSALGALETVRVSGFDCPSCGERLLTETSGPSACPGCGWHGDVYLLKALREKAQPAMEALSGQAVCAHHPTKQAVATCAGTGDYICSLCAVEMDGKIYSAEYLSRAGKAKLRKSFSRHMERPDRQAAVALLVGLIIFFLAPVTIPYAIHRYIKAIRQRKTDELYRRVFSRFDAFLLGTFVFILSGGAVLIAVAVIFD